MKLRRIAGWSALALVGVGVAAGLVAYVRSDNTCSAGAPPAAANPMKAIVYCDYGDASVVKFANVEKPVPTDSQVLIRVHAASVNPLDWHYMRGEPRIGRLGMGLRKPKELRLGVDYAGTVEAVGRSVTRLKPGDEVFGARTGAFAEYVTTHQDRPVFKPANLSFEQAAAVPVAAVTALQGVRDKGEVRAGQRVLINGASGGVGTFAVQIAKSLGANVTGVSSTRNLELVRSLGADQVIDYTKEDFTKGTQRYDVIIDMVGNHSLSEFRRVLTPDGKYVMVGGPSGRWIAPLPRALRAIIVSRFVKQDLRFFMAETNQKDLNVLRDLMQTGKVTPVIDRAYKLSETPTAIAYLEEGHARGKVVIVVH
jgi:NADPH:quinone reductase-like Zn-dependent oxidoreductase